MALSGPTQDEIASINYEYYMLGDGKPMRFAVVEPANAPRGTVLIAQGRREFIEKKYIEVGHDLRLRGFRVIMFDWRGQGLSGRFFSDARRQYDHIIDFLPYIDDIRMFYRDVVKKRCAGPLVVCAHSKGCLITTRWLAESTPQNAPDVKAVIMTAPALAIGVPPGSHAIAKGFVRMGFGEHYAVGLHDYGGRDLKFERNVLSHDAERFNVIEKYFVDNPNLTVGGVTWSWLDTVLESIEHLHRPGYLERIKMPVLALLAGKDIVTPPVKVIPLLRRMPHAEAVMIPGALHDLLNEADVYRNEAWRQMDLFLARVLK